jgi:hypothetical protein
MANGLLQNFRRWRLGDSALGSMRIAWSETTRPSCLGSHESYLIRTTLGTTAATLNLNPLLSHYTGSHG